MMMFTAMASWLVWLFLNGFFFIKRNKKNDRLLVVVNGHRQCWQSLATKSICWFINFVCCLFLIEIIIKIKILNFKIKTKKKYPHYKFIFFDCENFLVILTWKEFQENREKSFDDDVWSASAINYMMVMSGLIVIWSSASSTYNVFFAGHHF